MMFGGIHLNITVMEVEKWTEVLTKKDLTVP